METHQIKRLRAVSNPTRKREPYQIRLLSLYWPSYSCCFLWTFCGFDIFNTFPCHRIIHPNKLLCLWIEKSLERNYIMMQCTNRNIQERTYLVVMLYTQPSGIITILVRHLNWMMRKIWKRTIRIPCFIEENDAWFMWSDSRINCKGLIHWWDNRCDIW